jgi:Acyl-CoA reductase (LuxC)
MTTSRRPVRSLIRAVSDAARRWSDGDFPPRVRALTAVSRRTGYSSPVAEYAFDRLFSSISNDAMVATIAGELGSLDALDGFVERNGMRMRALPAGRTCIIASRTTIGVAIVPAIFAICAGCDVTVKDREDFLVDAFFRTLVEELPDLSQRIAAQTWDGSASQRHLRDFETVVAFGDRTSLEAIRSLCAAESRFIAYGPRTSAGYVARESLDGDIDALAREAARDAVLYDTEGCLSLRTIFVERGGAVSPEVFFSVLAREMERAAIEFPPSRSDPGAIAAVGAAHDLGTFRAANGRGAVRTDAARSYVAVFDGGFDRAPDFLPRTVTVLPIDAASIAVDYLRHHALAIEAWSASSQRADIVEAAIASGAARVAAFGALQNPPLSTPHGGRPRIAEFVQWVSDER